MKIYVKFVFIFLIFFISCSEVTSPPYISPPLALDAIIYINNDIELLWTDSSDNEDGFKIDRKIEDSEWVEARGITSENVESWIDSFSWEVKHYYRVYAFKGEYSSEYSNIYEIGGD